MEKISISTGSKKEIADITSKVQSIVKSSGLEKGECIIYCPHTTAAITINENYDPDVKRDILYALSQIVPSEGYHHSEGNSDGHVMSSLIGVSEKVLFSGGKLNLGRWQGILFCEFDGPREREIYVMVR